MSFGAPEKWFYFVDIVPRSLTMRAILVLFENIFVLASEWKHARVFRPRT